MDIKNYNSNIYFQAKFLKSDSLTDIVNYAIEHNKFDKLNQARKNIDNSYVQRRLKVHICDTDGKPTIIISRYEPPKNKLALSLDDYELTAQTEFISTKKMNPLKFALETIIKMGNSAPNNKTYKKVVVEKGKIIDNFFA